MPETPPVKRRLTAILAADAVSYSARMAEDEERTLRTLAGHRRLIDGLITDHGGRIVTTAGDSVLAEFGSSVEAVRCAVEIQDALATRNESLPESERLHFRIGINLGDVIVDGDDILGDGVNVASRLEGIADPGGICIASSVFDQISGKLNLGFEDIGERSLKNIGRPVRAYRVARAGAPRRVQRRSRRGALVFAAIGGAAVAVAAAMAVLYVTGARDRGGNVSPTPAVEPAPPVVQAPASQPPVPPPAASQPGASAAAPPAAVRAAKPPPERASAGADAASPALRAADPAPASPAARPQAPVAFTTGLAQARCQRPDGTPGPAARGRVQVVNGEVIIDVGGPAQPGQVSLRGRPDADGTLVLEGFIIPGVGRARGTKVAARYEGRLTDGRGMLTGVQGQQRCSLALQLK